VGGVTDICALNAAGSINFRPLAVTLQESTYQVPGTRYCRLSFEKQRIYCLILN